MAVALESTEDHKIKLIRELLKRHFFKKTGIESVVITFEELGRIPLLSDEMGFKHTLGTIRDRTDGFISYREAFADWRTRKPNDRAMTADPSLPQIIGYEIHVANPEKIEEHFASLLNPRVRLSESEVDYDDASATLLVEGRKCQFPPAMNEHLLCRVMFLSPLHVAVDWSVIYEEMTGNDPIEIKAGTKSVSKSIGKEITARTRMVRDTMHAANKRIHQDVNTQDDLFTWENKSVTRNFGES